MNNPLPLTLSVVVLSVVAITSATARPVYLSQWQTRYSNSNSDAATCQLCHQGVNGGNGWNSYGWAIRSEYLVNGNNINAAFTIVENVDSEMDPEASINLSEINASSQPGWTAGSVNTIFFKNDTTLVDQPPPTLTTALDPQRIIDPIITPISTSTITVALEPVASGLVAPNYATTAPGLPDLLFVVDQPGIIWRIDLLSGSRTIFLDVSTDLVSLGIFGPSSFDERGLLGLAFHPDYAQNGRLYTYTSEPVSGAADFSTIPIAKSANHQSVIAEWQVQNPADPTSVVDNSSKRALLRIDQPQFNHNGGGLAFGPDANLYIALGDGGGADDIDGQQAVNGPMIGHGSAGNGQDASNPLGAILRINPGGNNSANGQYGIPVDNPFTDGADTRLDEIYAYGFRNPFRFSFDTLTGDLYAGDVGQNDVEEINVVVSGGNYGWNRKEGSFVFNPNGNADGFVSSFIPADLPGDLIDPLLEYDHDEGISVIGGFVYRGSAIPHLVGHYVFGDWSLDFSVPSGRLFHGSESQDIQEFMQENQVSLDLFVQGFGQDAAGELYLLGNTTGTPFGITGVVLRIAPDTATANGIFSDQFE